MDWKLKVILTLHKPLENTMKKINQLSLKLLKNKNVQKNDMKILMNFSYILTYLLKYKMFNMYK